MDSLVGQVAVMKVTGEKVFVLEQIDKMYTVDTKEYVIRRPQVNEKGMIFHITETVSLNELETHEQHADRQIAEAIIRAKSQKKIALIENELMKEFEAEQYVGPAEASTDALAVFDEPVESKREVTIMRPKDKKVN